MIAVECYADTQLVLTLGASAAAIRHARGKGNVLILLRDNKADVGLIDEDPGSAEYPEMRNYRVTEVLGRVRLMRHLAHVSKRVIVICPRLEEWMLERARQAGVDPLKYGLASDPLVLHDKGRYDRKQGFRPFVERLAQTDSEVKKVREWITR